MYWLYPMGQFFLEKYRREDGTHDNEENSIGIGVVGLRCDNNDGGGKGVSSQIATTPVHHTVRVLALVSKQNRCPWQKRVQLVPVLHIRHRSSPCKGPFPTKLESAAARSAIPTSFKLEIAG